MHSKEAIAIVVIVADTVMPLEVLRATATEDRRATIALLVLLVFALPIKEETANVVRPADTATTPAPDHLAPPVLAMLSSVVTAKEVTPADTATKLLLKLPKIKPIRAIKYFALFPIANYS